MSKPTDVYRFASFLQMLPLSETIRQCAGKADASDPLDSYYPQPVPSVTVFAADLELWAKRAELLEQGTPGYTYIAYSCGNCGKLKPSPWVSFSDPCTCDKTNPGL